MKQIYFKTGIEWHQWLIDNHDTESEVWLIFYKRGTGKPTMPYESSVEEALCFGWIDSIIKKIDDEKYVRKFTPRKDNSVWSELNKKRVNELILSKRMTEFGLVKVEKAKRNGQWDKTYRPDISLDIPEEFQKALDQNKKAKSFFYQLAPTYQKHYLGWINYAKRMETREKRIWESIRLLEKGQKLGLK
jgi:uncharacterized protein YdeI (YjbR/CyaY-like superfamily)